MSDNVVRIMFYDETRGWVVDTVEATEQDNETNAVLVSESESSANYAQA